MATGFLQAPLVVELDIDVSAVAGLTYTATRAFDVFDAIVIPTVFTPAATMQLLDVNFQAVTDAMVCQSVSNISRAATLLITSFAAGSPLRIQAAGGAVPQNARCICNVFVMPPGVPVTLA